MFGLKLKLVAHPDDGIANRITLLNVINHVSNA